METSLGSLDNTGPGGLLLVGVLCWSKPADAMDATNGSDELAMIRAAAAGDDRAFDRVVDHYAARLLWLVRMRLDCAIQGRVGPDDVLQEALLVVHRQIGALEIESEAAFWSWLCRVVEQRIADARRKHLQAAGRDARRERRISEGRPQQTTSVQMDQLLSGTLSTPSARLRTAEQREALGEMLEKLPASYREVIVLRMLEGQSVSETATIMGRSPGAVSVLLTKAVKRLGNLIETEGRRTDFIPRS